MATVTVESNMYKVDPLYQWDLNQTLVIYGLSLARTPEIHFTNASMGRAIVRQATMNAAGVVSVSIPNSVLQQAGTLKVYVCTYEGVTFQTLYKIEVEVKARTQPADYTLTDDPEVYSFNALENQVVNVLDKYATVDAKLTAAKTAYEGAKAIVDDAVNNAVATVLASIPTLTAAEIQTPCESGGTNSDFLNGTGLTTLWGLVKAADNSAINRTTSVAAADTNYTTLMARGASLNSAETTPAVNGAIAWTYA